jgi:UDP-glucose 4-epimerase
VSEERTLDHPANEAFPLAARRRGKRVVAITGAATFLGENLIGFLEDDESIERIVGIDTAAPQTAQEKTRLYPIDLSQSAAEDHLGEVLTAEAVDTLVHLSFLPSPTHASAYCHEFESVGTMRVLNACRRSHVNKFVMWSQSVLYGARPDNPNFLSEDHPLRARSAPFFRDKAPTRCRPHARRSLTARRS